MEFGIFFTGDIFMLIVIYVLAGIFFFNVIINFFVWFVICFCFVGKSDDDDDDDDDDFVFFANMIFLLFFKWVTIFVLLWDGEVFFDFFLIDLFELLIVIVLSLVYIILDLLLLILSLLFEISVLIDVKLLLLCIFWLVDDIWELVFKYLVLVISKRVFLIVSFLFFW